MDRRKTADVIFYALQCAKSDRFAYADAVSADPKAYKEALADIKAFEVLQRKIFGTSDSQLDAETKRMKLASITDLLKMIETNPELFIHSVDCECSQCLEDKRSIEMSA